ncbi:hypothetical protein HGRIS_006403 [Hohenbuehelia grisea]|uniref:AVL9/DENND6 domain-containing protein n=1 Tax=Hohenbuehelia grisea TaxID=104357 RepID=A0ABR3JZT1_9AGAR
MFYGHPVERLCTYQYSLVSLLPGLLQTLDDCGSPPLAERARTLSRPTSLRTSDHKSMMAFMGLPLDVFGQDAFFQPYLPLQQLDVLKETGSWLCGTTNSIVTQQKEIDLLVNTETGAFEFRDPQLERIAGLTAADRKWMDTIVKDVNDSLTEGEGMRFRGSDDYLRTKFEEYIHAALSSVKYRDFTTKGESNGVIITGGTGGDPKATEDFNLLWIAEFKRTRAYDVWDRVTDPLIFDIVEPRHPCNEKPTVVSDLGLRLQEGIQDLKLDQQLAPAREAVTRTFAAGSTNFFKAVEGVRGRWQRSNSSSTSLEQGSRSSTPVEISKTDAIEELTESPPGTARPVDVSKRSSAESNASAGTSASANANTITSPGGTMRPALSAWGSSIGGFFSARAPKFAYATSPVVTPAAAPATSPPESEAGSRPASVAQPVAVPATLPPPTTTPPARKSPTGMRPLLAGTRAASIPRAPSQERAPVIPRAPSQESVDPTVIGMAS